MKGKLIQRGVTETEAIAFDGDQLGNPASFTGVFARLKDGWRVKAVEVVFERTTFEHPTLVAPPKRRRR